MVNRGGVFYTIRDMARVKLTEYRAKSLLVDSYDGVSIHFVTAKNDIAKLGSKQKYIVKVDQGVKKRGKQGLIRLNVTRSTAKKAVEELAEFGFDCFIAESMVQHDDSEERYLSIERTRGGVMVLYSKLGGVDIEDNPDSVKQYTDISKVPLPKKFVEHLVGVMNRENLSFIEINPLVVRGQECKLLDAAVLADSAGMNAGKLGWSDDDIADMQQKLSTEVAIAELNGNSPASFSFRVLKPNGSIWLLLSGGGASITIADEAANRGKAELVGNYGEYSGGPTGEETQIYTEAVLDQMLRSSAKKRALVIAGGVANFTDVKKTFTGIIAALKKNVDALNKAKIKVFVRRGGPNESEGLELMEEFLKQNKMFGSVHGSQTILTAVVDEALEYVDA